MKKKLNLCLFALVIGLAFLLQNCSKDDTIVQYKLTTDVTPALSGSVSPSSGTFDEGTEISLTATPASEYVFKNWSSGASGTENPLSVIMNSNKNITAVFEKKNYSLNIVIVGEGTVTEEIIQAKSAGDYPSGTIVKLTAVPSAEWEFVEWSGDYDGTENPIQITIDKAMNITAKFEKKNYLLNIVTVGEGTVTEEIIQAKSAGDYPSGTIVKLTAVPSAGWFFFGWSGDYQGAENPIQLTINKPTTLTATFAEPSSKTYVPDDNFEQALIDLGYDNVLDDYVYTDIIDKITELHVSVKGIEDLTGIEDFVALTTLVCSNNQLTNLDVSKNIALTALVCSNNQLSLLDLSKNTKIIWLLCENNQLTSLDVSNLIDLRELVCSHNQLISLDVSNNNFLGVGMVIWFGFNCFDNLLTCIQVNIEQLANIDSGIAYLWTKDDIADYSLDCHY